MPRVEFGELVEYVTEDGGDLIIHQVELSQHSLDVLPVLAAVRDDYTKVAALGRAPALDTNQVTAIQGAIAEVYHQDVADHEVSADPAGIVDRLLWVRSRPEWHVGLQCVAADAARTVGVYFNPADKNLYQCIQPHTAQADWRPDLPGVAALWIRFYEPEEGPQPWVQPYGGSGTYMSGALVTHNGKTWRNIIPAPTLNVWEPGVYGWEVV